MPLKGQKKTTQPKAVSNTALTKLKTFIREKYHSFIQSYLQVIWPTVVNSCPNRSVFEKSSSQISFDIYNLNLAIDDIIQDIKIIADRRSSLITVNKKGELMMTAGKLAGVIIYRLAKRQIVHCDSRCLSCHIRCVTKLNAQFALRCGTEFINIEFNIIDELLQKELFFQLTSRHVNQETLGLIFDTINIYTKKK